MKRLTPEQEKDIISPETEAANIASFQSILPVFQISEETNKTVQDILTGKRHPIDEMLKLDQNGRAFFEIDDPNSNDSLYQEYRSFLSEGYESVESWDYRLILKSLYNDKTSFTDGKFIHKKQEVKLFKWLLKVGILDAEKVGYLNSKRTQKAKAYICLSRNPVDFIYCATDHSFTSCLSLTSDYSAAYYMSLGGLVADTSRFMMMITNKRLKEHKVRDQTFKHLSIQSRCWGYVNVEKGEVFLDREYPSNNYDLGSILKKHLNVVRGDDFVSSSFICPASNSELDISRYLPYLDSVQARNIKDALGRVRYAAGEGGGAGSFDLDSEEGFEGMEVGPRSERVRCADCESRHNISNMTAVGSGDYICSGCLEENYSLCQGCDEYHRADDLYEINSHEYCDLCRQNLFTRCNECNEWVSTSEVDEKNGVCEDCLAENFEECSGCGNHHHLGEILHTSADEPYCPDCYNLNFTKCSKCGEEIKVGRTICQECEEEKVA